MTWFRKTGMSVAELKEYVDLRVQGGLSIKYVSQRLDHKTIQKTADIYLDITEKNRRRRT